jgi:hypothetical protein
MKLCCLALLGLLFPFICISQTTTLVSTDSVFYHESLANVSHVYFTEIRDNAEIYHGSEFIRNGQRAIGFPFFEADEMLNGSIYYQGTLYSGIPLYYNMVSDEIIINNYPRNAFLSLSPLKADSFIISSRLFVHLSSGKSDGLPRSGYYEKLTSGDPALFAKKEKRLVIGTGSEETKYIEYDNYYIRFKNVYYPVDGKNALLDVLKDREDDLKKFIRSNKLNFKKNPESSLVQVTTYYSRTKQ